MMTKERYIWKAKHQRGLTDEQIQYFLDRDTRYELMPYYSLCCKRLGCEQGYIKTVEQYGEDTNKEYGYDLHRNKIGNQGGQ